MKSPRTPHEALPGIPDQTEVDVQGGGRGVVIGKKPGGWYRVRIHASGKVRAQIWPLALRSRRAL
jgi:hypothetical protein